MLGCGTGAVMQHMEIGSFWDGILVATLKGPGLPDLYPCVLESAGTNAEVRHTL